MPRDHAAIARKAAATRRRHATIDALRNRAEVMRAEAYELRETGDADMWYLAARMDREADNLETLAEQRKAHTGGRGGER